MSIVAVLLAVVAVGALAALFGVVRAQRRLVAGRNDVHDAWAGIDVQLTKRSELVPSLVAVVQGYAAHESATLDAVLAARATLANATDVADKGVADRVLVGSLAGMIGLREDYPNLKANEQFGLLQRQLAQIEDDLAAALRYYNGCVKAYEDIRATFPTNAIAPRLRFVREEYFQA